MNTFTKAFALVLFSLPLVASAAGKTASAAMQVTFEVKEACTVQAAADRAAKAAPAVACQLHTPYQLTHGSATKATTSDAATSADTQASALRQQAASGEWTITF